MVGLGVFVLLAWVMLGVSTKESIDGEGDWNEFALEYGPQAERRIKHTSTEMNNRENFDAIYRSIFKFRRLYLKFMDIE